MRFRIKTSRQKWGNESWLCAVRIVYNDELKSFTIEPAPGHEEEITIIWDSPTQEQESTFELLYMQGEEDDAVVGTINNLGFEVVRACFKQIEDSGFDWIDKGDGIYTINVGMYNEEQTGEYGRVEVPGYWDMEIVGFRTIEEDMGVEQESQQGECEACDGNGAVKEWENDNKYYQAATCSKCNGTGREDS